MSEQHMAAASTSVGRTRSTGQIVGGVLLGVAGLLTLPDFFAQLANMSSGGSVDGFAFAYLALFLVGAVGLIVAGVLGALRSSKIIVFVGFGWFVFRLFANLLISVGVAATFTGWSTLAKTLH